MKKLFCLLIFTTIFAQEWVSPDAALQMLLDGNDRYVNDAPIHPNRGKEQRMASSLGQKPFAVIVGCSDSRAAPEIIFDQGVGDLFVVRVAGNVIGPIELDSVEYSAVYLNSSVIIIMGHENCGAIDAVIAGKTKDIEAVADLIQPSVKEARKRGPKNLLYRATVENANRMKEYLLGTPVIHKLVQEGKVQVYSAYYNFESGKVDIIGN